MQPLRAAVEDPRRAVAARLAEHGLSNGERGGWHDTDDAPWGVRFREAVCGLGPSAVLFGRYLATRADLLAIDDLLALAELGPEDLAATLPSSVDIAQRVAAELGRPSEEIFSSLNPEPATSSLFYDEFHARLREDGDNDAGLRLRVVVRLRRAGLEVDEAELAALRPAFDGILRASRSPFSSGRGGAFAELLEDFRQDLQARLDQRAEIQALQRFADDVVDRDLVTVPELLPQLSTPKLSVRRELPGTRFKDLGADGCGHDAPRCRELARRLHLAWLQQALVAGHVPVDGEWVECRDGRVAVVGGRFERLPAASLPRLWSYLRHLAGYRLEDAHDAVIGELRAVRRDADERQLRLGLRQLVPFRDGGWSERRDTLAELLTLHWQLTRRMGFEPSPALAVLWSGLFRLAIHSRHLDDGGDPLRSALEDLRWLVSFQRLRQLADPGQIGDVVESNLASLMEVPQKLDRLLQAVTGEDSGDLRLRLRVAESPDAQRRRSALTTAICVGLLMAAVALLAPRLTVLGLSEDWTEPGTAAVFLGLAAVLLRTITRR